MDSLFDSIQHTRINDTRTADALYLLGSFNKVTGGNLCSFILQIHDALIQLCRLFAGLTAPSSFYHSFVI